MKRKFETNTDALDFSEVQSTLKPVKSRIDFIDLAKTLAIALMILTHVIALLYAPAEQNQIIYTIGVTGGIASYTTFLFLSGLSLSASNKYIGKRNLKKWVGGLMRILKLFLVYFVVALVGIFVVNDLYQAPIQLWLRSFVDVVTFRNFVEFTEFLPSFAIFTAIYLLIPRVLRFISNRLPLVLVVSIATFFIAQLFVTVDLGGQRLNLIKSLFVGHTTESIRLHSFPIFQYLFIFLLALYVGKKVIENSSVRYRLKLFGLLFFAFMALTSAAVILYARTGNNLFYIMPIEGRFPPSLGFIFFSMFIAIIIILLAILLAKMPFYWRVRKIIQFFSKNALSFLATHVIVLFAFVFLSEANLFDTKVQNPLTLLLAYIGVVALSSISIFVIVNPIKMIVFESITPTKFNKIAANVLIAMSLAAIFLVYTYNRFELSTVRVSGSSFSRSINKPRDSLNWWDYNYRFRQRLIIGEYNKDFANGDGIQVVIPAKDFLDQGYNLDTLKNTLNVIYKNPVTQEQKQAKFQIKDFNENGLVLAIKSERSVIAGVKEDSYFLYYNGGAKVDSSEFNIYHTVETGSTLATKETPLISLNFDRKWVVKTPDNSKLLNTSGISAQISGVSVENLKFIYTISDGTNPPVSKPVTANTDGVLTVGIDYLALSPGQYKVQVIGINTKEFTAYSSNIATFNLSYPLYVTWTQDWEGWSVPDYNLYEMGRISAKYNIPIVHLFNPRIYVKEQTSVSDFGFTSPERAAYLTSWVLSRMRNNGDEIGLHLHMFDDMVKEAGVEPRYNPISGAYADTKTNAYTREELVKIFTWALDRFAENGLPKPKSYRTGAWMSGPNVLQALNDVGIIIDTTGRTGGYLTPNNPGSSRLPWNLSSTTRPYRPNVADINSWSGERLSLLWEFPNNGADSYWFQASDLIQRFNDNYNVPNGIMTKPQVLTYLSHPHWQASVDSPKLEQTFTHISQFLARNDAGPVVFTTLERAYSEWDRVNMINGD